MDQSRLMFLRKINFFKISKKNKDNLNVFIMGGDLINYGNNFNIIFFKNFSNSLKLNLSAHKKQKLINIDNKIKIKSVFSNNNILNIYFF